MKQLYENTGGNYVMTDSFKNAVFKESFEKFFEVDENSELKMGGSLGQFKCLCSKEIKIHGAIGEMTSLKQKNNHVSDTEIGIGQTNQWFLGGIDKNKSIAVYFDVVNTQS